MAVCSAAPIAYPSTLRCATYARWVPPRSCPISPILHPRLPQLQVTTYLLTVAAVTPHSSPTHSPLPSCSPLSFTTWTTTHKRTHTLHLPTRNNTTGSLSQLPPTAAAAPTPHHTASLTLPHPSAHPPPDFGTLFLGTLSNSTPSHPDPAHRPLIHPSALLCSALPCLALHASHLHHLYPPIHTLRPSPCQSRRHECRHHRDAADLGNLVFFLFSLPFVYYIHLVALPILALSTSRAIRPTHGPASSFSPPAFPSNTFPRLYFDSACLTPACQCTCMVAARRSCCGPNRLSDLSASPAP